MNIAWTHTHTHTHTPVVNKPKAKVMSILNWENHVTRVTMTTILLKTSSFRMLVQHPADFHPITVYLIKLLHEHKVRN